LDVFPSARWGGPLVLIPARRFRPNLLIIAGDLQKGMVRLENPKESNIPDACPGGEKKGRLADADMICGGKGGKSQNEIKLIKKWGG